MQTIGIGLFLFDKKKEKGKRKCHTRNRRKKECNPFVASSSGNNFVNTGYVRWINQAANLWNATSQTTSFPLLLTIGGESSRAPHIFIEITKFHTIWNLGPIWKHFDNEERKTWTMSVIVGRLTRNCREWTLRFWLWNTWRHWDSNMWHRLAGMRTSGTWCWVGRRESGWAGEAEVVAWVWIDSNNPLKMGKKQKQKQNHWLTSSLWWYYFKLTLTQ